MKRLLTAIVLATVLAGIPVFASALNGTERKAGVTLALPSPQVRRRNRRRYMIVRPRVRRRRMMIMRRPVYRRRRYRRIHVYRR